MKTIWNQKFEKIAAMFGTMFLLSVLFFVGFFVKSYAEEYTNPYVISLKAVDVVEGTPGTEVSSVAMDVKLFRISESTGNELGVSYSVVNGRVVYSSSDLNGGTNTSIYAECGENGDGILEIYNIPAGTYKVKFMNLYPESADYYAVSWEDDEIEFTVSDSTVDANKKCQVSIPVSHKNDVTANVYTVGNHVPFAYKQGYFKTEGGKIVTFTDKGISDKTHKYQFANLLDATGAIPDSALIKFGALGEEKAIFTDVPDMKWTFVPTNENPFDAPIPTAMLSGEWKKTDTRFFGNVLNYCDYGLTKIEAKGDGESIDASFKLSLGEKGLKLSAYDLLEINGVMYSNVYVVTGLSDYPADLKTLKGTAYLYYPVSMNDNGVLKAPSYQLKEVTVKEKYQLLTSPVKLNTPEIKESGILEPKATEKQTGVQPLKDANSLYSNVNTLVHEKIPVTKVDVICMDMDANEVVAGAVFSVYKKSDLENGVPKSGARYLDQWKTEAGMKRVIQELEAGESYVVIESDVPAGYVKSRPLEFTVLSAGETTRVIVPMQKTKVLVSKWDATNDKALAGVTMQILDTRGNIVTEWTTEETDYVVTGKLSVGIRYILHEAAPVKGYSVAADSVIVLLPDGTLSKEETTAEIKDEEKNLVVVKNVLSSSGDSKNEGSSSQITDNTSGGGASGTDGKDTGYVKTGDDNTFANLYLPVLLAGVVLILLILTIRWDRRER